VRRLGEDLGSKSPRRRTSKNRAAVPVQSDKDEFVMRFDELPKFDPTKPPYEGRSVRLARRWLARVGIRWNPYQGARIWKARWLSDAGCYFIAMLIFGIAFIALDVTVVTGSSTTRNANPVVPFVVGVVAILCALTFVLLSARRVSEGRNGALRFRWIRRHREVDPGEIEAVTRLGVGLRARTLFPLVVRTPTGSFLLWPAMTNEGQLLEALELHSPEADLSFVRRIWS
jgi:hypothetical protein